MNNQDYIEMMSKSVLTKREAIAAMAMQGLLANPTQIGPGSEKTDLHIAQDAVHTADTLLAELAKAK